jgi:predicted HTH transcriptional regulator
MSTLQNSVIPFWQQPESRRLEFKELLPKGDHLARTVVAFANGAGGKIIFGVLKSWAQGDRRSETAFLLPYLRT